MVENLDDVLEARNVEHDVVVEAEDLVDELRLGDV